MKGIGLAGRAVVRFMPRALLACRASGSIEARPGHRKDGTLSDLPIVIFCKRAMTYHVYQARLHFFILFLRCASPFLRKDSFSTKSFGYVHMVASILLFKPIIKSWNDFAARCCYC